VRIEVDGRLVRESERPGRQGRVLLAMRVGSRERPLTRDELEDELWGDDLPPAWTKRLNALISKLRAVLAAAGIGADSLTHSLGCFQQRAPGRHLGRRRGSP
jgi:DNA-binding SARP family transcriptional activator